VEIDCTDTSITYEGMRRFVEASREKLKISNGVISRKAAGLK
jgi:hypothetical protein